MTPAKPGGRPMARRSQSSTRVSISVAAGDVSHIMHCAPSAAVAISARTDGGLELAGKNAKKPRVLPMRNAGEDDTLEIVEDRFHRLAVLRRRFGKRPRDLPRRRLRAHRIVLDALHVVGHPLDHAAPVAAKFFGCHGLSRAARDRTSAPTTVPMRDRPRQASHQRASVGSTTSDLPYPVVSEMAIVADAIRR